MLSRRCDEETLRQRFLHRNPTATRPRAVCCAAAEFFRRLLMPTIIWLTSFLSLCALRDLRVQNPSVIISAH